MKAKEYIQKLKDGEPIEQAILEMNEEFMSLKRYRKAHTVGTIVPLFMEFDAKWRIIAKAIEPRLEDLFENAMLATYPEIEQAILQLRIARRRALDKKEVIYYQAPA